MDCFSRLLDLAVSNGLIRGVLNHKIEGGASHFMFTDDLILFCKNDGLSLRKLLLLLKCFELAAGLKVNLAKSSILCLKANPSLTSRLALEIGCKESSFPLKYLGLPLRDGCLQKADWLNLISSLDSWLSSWSGRLFSRADRLTLINSVITAYTSYLLSLFNALKWVITNIDRQRRNGLLIVLSSEMPRQSG
ncbi:hypothetical protein Cni_G09701 [Canna indica]|uniref:Reverse transcriptase domain-containing protein n=1 Tax=Canna indica TaxID=4628 RepID=A0AAQ3Q9K3_9LILI|nr:hypothetical protein Cni_G09701 [Canna indica]